MTGLPTFSETVAAYLDQYKAAETGGKFISVDPDGDGKKQAIFVSDSGKVNPSSDSPGKWNGYVPGSEAKGKKQEKDSPGQLGLQKDQFTGKYKRKPEKQEKLPNQDAPEPKPKPKYKAGPKLPKHQKVKAPRENKDGTIRANSRAKVVPVEGIKPIKFSNEGKDSKKLHTDKQGNVIARETHNWDENAKAYGFEEGHEPTAEEMQELKSRAKELKSEHDARVEEIRDAYYQIFGPDLNKWQRRARAAKDPDGVLGLDVIIGGQTYSEDDTNYLPVIAENAGYVMQGGEDNEEMAFQALRKPLPKKKALAHPDFIIEAAKTMAGDSGFDPDAPPDDWDYGENGDDEIPDDQFAALTFRDAVARYAGQLGLWDDQITGKFKSKGQKQGKLFDAKGNASKDQPRVEKGSKEGGQWTKGNSPTTPKMDEARRKFTSETKKLGRFNKKDLRRTIAKTIEKMGGEKKLRNSKTHELSQEEFILSQVMRISDKRSRMFGGKKPLAKFLQRYQGKPEVSWREFATEIKEIEGGPEAFDEMNKETNGGGNNRSRGQWSAEEAFGWIRRNKSINLDLETEMGMLKHFYQTANFKKSAITKHREEVRKAIKKGIDVGEEVYGEYHDADWQPGNKSATKRAAMKFCNEVDDIKKTDGFRLQASVGKKIKASANDSVDGWRKKFIKDYEAAEKVALNASRVEYGDYPKLGDEDSRTASEHEASIRAWNANHREIMATAAVAEEKRNEVFMQSLESLPSKPLRAKGKSPAITFAFPKSWTDEEKTKAEESAVWIEKVSDGSLQSMNIPTKSYRGNRSFHRSGEIHMSRKRLDKRVLIHELGHAIDWHTDIGAKTKSFEAQAIAKHRTRWTGGACENNEVGSRNGFMDNYTGKYYAGRNSSEVLSMGMQELHQNPARFAKKSPDHFNYTLAAMRNLL